MHGDAQHKIIQRYNWTTWAFNLKFKILFERKEGWVTTTIRQSCAANSTSRWQHSRPNVKDNIQDQISMTIFQTKYQWQNSRSETWCHAPGTCNVKAMEICLKVKSYGGKGGRKRKILPLISFSMNMICWMWLCSMIIMVLPQVLEARNLPDTDNFFLSKLINRKDVTDPYVSGYLDTTKVKMIMRNRRTIITRRNNG